KRSVAGERSYAGLAGNDRSPHGRWARRGSGFLYRGAACGAAGRRRRGAGPRRGIRAPPCPSAPTEGPRRQKGDVSGRRKGGRGGGKVVGGAPVPAGTGRRRRGAGGRRG